MDEETTNINIKSGKNHVYFYSEVVRDSTYELINCLRMNSWSIAGGTADKSMVESLGKI